MFAGKEKQRVAAYQAMEKANLSIAELTWYKGFTGGVLGPRVNYCTEKMFVGWTTPTKGEDVDGEQPTVPPNPFYFDLTPLFTRHAHSRTPTATA
jgi:hypothetical protein